MILRLAKDTANGTNQNKAPVSSFRKPHYYWHIILQDNLFEKNILENFQNHFVIKLSTLTFAAESWQSGRLRQS
jgi:hypothetical protein